MGTPLFIVDAFAARPLAGNQAAVCLLQQPAAAAWMQQFAAEMNFAETAYVVPGDGAFQLRWFTPTVEVELCGHATLASAHILWETGRSASDEEIRFDTVHSGWLTCRRNQDWIEMDFPSDPPSPCETPAILAEGLLVTPPACAKGRYDYLVELASEADVRTLEPDFRALSKLPVRGIIATARGSGEFDFVSRFFGPAAGIDEDPATGSAHCVLAPYWAERLGKQEMTGFQASRRGGTVRVRTAGDRVILGGQAWTTVAGEISCQRP